ncbi:hypothetical protein [Streptomyces sp. NPDC101150]|uniref:hypothetical protein n=1 Tax=Streptomyces sp. NPDC101150 TaxID=3366114 RepID=UPI0038202D59
MLRTVSRGAAVAALGVALPLTFAAVPAGAAPVAAHRSSGAAAGAVLTDPNGRHDATDIRRFLTAFYGHHGPTDWAREHQVSDYLKDRAAQTEGYDLLLCAQNTPREISIGKVTTAQSAGVGWATVTTIWDDGDRGSFTAYVGLDSKPIELQDVDCAP